MSIPYDSLHDFIYTAIGLTAGFVIGDFYGWMSRAKLYKKEKSLGDDKDIKED